MASNLHDSDNHVPPVAATDVWDDGDGLPRQIRDSGGVILPQKRARATAAPVRSSHTESPGLRIHVQAAARPAATTVPIMEYGGEVVRLEQALTEGPFQAAKIIPAQPLTAAGGARELQGEGQDWGQTRPHPLRWLVMAGVLVGGVLVAALATQELLRTPKAKARTAGLELVEPTQVEPMQGFELDGPSEENARALLAAYAVATTPKAVIPLIRNAPRLTQRLTQNWHAWQVPANWLPAHNATWQISAAGGRNHGCLSGRKPDFTPYQVFFVREGEALRIDWEATEGLGDATFATLARGRGMGGTIRTYATPENFYSLVFPETEFRSYKLLAADHEQVVWGYVKLGDPAAAALLKVFESAMNNGELPAEQAITLRLTPPPAGAQKNQWLIGEMLHIDWVSP